MKQKKENFFKRLKNAVINFDKYREYADEKVSVAIKYVLKLVLIFSIIIAVSLTIRVALELNRVIEAFRESCPDFKIENNSLVMQEENNNFIVSDSSNILCLIINSEKQSLTEIEDANNYQSVIAILKDKIVLKNSFSMESSTTYEQLGKSYELNNITKQGILSYITNKNMAVMFATLVIGSTIDMLCRENTEVWGAGIIDGTKPLKCTPKKVYAVRGPLTRKVLLEQGVDCPEIYGDPALLVSKYYQPEVKKKYKYGFIAHVSNLDKVEHLLLDDMPIKDREDTLIIDLSKYDKWTDIPDQICSCESIISSSLHGLIMAEAYNIPNVWIEFGKPLIGGHFKFHDFFTSIGRDREEPVFVKDNKIEMKKTNENLKEWQAGHLDLAPLLKACPFKIKKPIYQQIL